MKTRVITAVVAIAAFAVFLFLLPPVCLAVVFAGFCAVGAYEVLGVTKIMAKTNPLLYISCAAAFAVSLISVYLPPVWLYAAAWLYLAAAFFFAVKDRETNPFSVVAKGCFAALLAPFMLSSVMRIFTVEQVGKYIILLPWVCVWVCDSAALFVGKAIGRKKLAPTVSPKKTVAGSVGGLIGGTVAAAIYVLVVNAAFDMSLHILPALIYGAVGTTAGQLGDLAFSLIKREAQIKDYGNLFPGHGGVYDRFDSITFAGAFFEILCLHILPIV